MLCCCLCLSLGSLKSDHDTNRLDLLLEHARIHNSQINRYAKVDIRRRLADCFPKIAAKLTVREIFDSMKPSQNSVSKDDVEAKTESMPAKSVKEVPQRQGTNLVKNTEKSSPIQNQGKRTSLQPLKESIHSQCRDILKASCDKNQRRFQCGVCNDLIVLRSPGLDRFDTRSAVSHVVSRHMDIKPFRCRYCDYTTKDCSTMCQHVKVAHQATDRRSDYYINEINAHQREICEMVANCFGKKQWKASENDSQTKLKITKQYGDKTPVAGKWNQSDTYDGKRNHLHAPSVIAAHCQRTMAPYSTRQHRFECLVCGTLVSLRSGQTSVLEHAVGHLDIMPFRCRYCNVAKKTLIAIDFHVKIAHKLAASSSIHYIDESSVHEKEICEMITKCFGKKDQVASGQQVSEKQFATFTGYGK